MFKDREEAGERLAEKLEKYKGVKGLLVLAIPRGGVVVGREVAEALNCPMGVIITKKIGAPENPELAIGAMGPDGMVVWNEELLSQLGFKPKDLVQEIQKAKLKMQNLRDKIGGIGEIREIGEIGDKVVILTDDGVATGATVEAALLYLHTEMQTCLLASRRSGPARQGCKDTKIILATPVIAADTLKKLKPMVDEVIYLEAPEVFWAVGQFYREFEQVSDEEVSRIVGDFREFGEFREN